MAKYKKKRARELKHDRFRDATMLLADKLADRVAGRGRLILYGLIGLVVIAAFASVAGVRYVREGFLVLIPLIACHVFMLPLPEFLRAFHPSFPG